MSDEFADAIEEVHDLLAPGPQLDDARWPIAGRALLKVTHQIRAFQQQVDLGLLKAMTRQRAENVELRGGSAAARDAVGDLHARVDELEARLGLLGALHDDMSDAVDGLTEELVAAQPATDDPRLIQYDGDQIRLGFRGHLAAAPMQPGFAELFRDDPATVREHHLEYLKLFTPGGLTLDIGCGQGSFVELLVDAGHDAVGIDIDPGMVALAEKRGLPMECLDALEYLEKQADHSIGGVFSSRLVEHLGPAELVRLLHLCREKLRPGGVFVAETANPHCARSLRQFWLDIGSRHPLFPEALLAWCGLAGLVDGAVLFPGGNGSFARDLRVVGKYAVVAYAPVEVV